jgi:hypothetical protein
MKTLPKTEAAFLRQQAADAKASATKTVREIGEGLSRSVDVRAWTGAHPWAAVSAAAAAGFAAVAVIFPSGRRLALRKLARIERELRQPEPASEAPHEPGLANTLMRDLAKAGMGLAFSVATNLAKQWAQTHSNGATPSQTEPASQTGAADARSTSDSPPSA